MNYFVIPGFLFVLLAYCSFWVSKNGVPARVNVGAVIILITINLISNIHNYIPQVHTQVWLANFLLGVLFFAVLAHLEFCVVNFCTVTYEALKKEIGDLVKSMQNIEAGNEKQEMKVLGEMREKADKGDAKGKEGEDALLKSLDSTVQRNIGA